MLKPKSKRLVCLSIQPRDFQFSNPQVRDFYAKADKQETLNAQSLKQETSDYITNY